MVDSHTDPPPQRDMVAAFTKALFGAGAAATAKTAQGLGKAAGSTAKTVGTAVSNTAKVTATAASQSAKATVTGATSLNLWWLLALAVRAVFLPVLVTTYVVVSAEGIRSLFDSLATPVHHLWPFLGQWKELRRVDVAMLLALVLLVWVWLAWEKVVCIYLYPPERLLNEEKLIWLVGMGLIALDGALFFLGLQASGGFLVSAAATFLGASILTSLYILMLVFAAYIVVKITHK